MYGANEYTIKYNQGMASSASNLPSNQTATYDSNITLATNSMTRDNMDLGTITFKYNDNGTSDTIVNAYREYSADGWATSSVGSKAYDSGASVKNLATSGTFDLYPHFSHTDKSPTFPSPSRTGYEFDGWYDGTTNYTSYNSSSDIELTAKWNANTYTVSLNQQDGSDGTESVIATYDSSMPSATMPSRTGYNFGGYFTETGGAGTQYYNSDGTSARNWDVASDTTLYAKWTGKTYTVTLNQQSGSGGTGSVTATYGSAMPSMTKPSRTGYTFQGYYTGTGGSGTQYYNSNGASVRSWDKTEAATLYAYWTANKYTVTLNQQSGSGGTGSVTATYGSAMPSMTRPSRTGYTFQGYYTGTGGSGTQYYNANGASVRSWDKTADTTLYAYWTGNTYTIAFNGNGNTGGSMSNLSMTYGTAKNLTANAFSKTDYVFVGWNTISDWSGTSYSNQQSVNNLATSGTVTLYAKWAKAQIGSTYYKTLQAAVDAATSGQTVTLLGNTTESITINSNKNLTINLNGKTLTLNTSPNGQYGATIRNYGTVTINNGTVNHTTTTSRTILNSGTSMTLNNLTINLTSCSETAVLTASGTTTINSCTINSSGYGVAAQGGSSVNVNNSRITASSGGAIVNVGGKYIKLVDSSVSSGRAIENASRDVIFEITTTSDGYKVSIYGDYSSISLPTWGDVNGQNDLIWHSLYYVSGNRWDVDIRKSEHKNETGTYISHLYVNNSYVAGFTFNVK